MQVLLSNGSQKESQFFVLEKRYMMFLVVIGFQCNGSAIAPSAFECFMADLHNIGVGYAIYRQQPGYNDAFL
jgi:hypothetical protein